MHMKSKKSFLNLALHDPDYIEAQEEFNRRMSRIVDKVCPTLRVLKGGVDGEEEEYSTEDEESAYKEG